MPREVLLGIAAGAVGTVALTAATYADIAVPARPPSSVPAEVADKLAEKAGVDPGSDEEAQIIGEVREDPPRIVVMLTESGGTRMIDMLIGDPLPRKC